ncbi:hypothetical protein JCM10295v2_006282 [Rhodotorula toruloides]
MQPLEQVTSNDSVASVELGDYIFCAQHGLERCEACKADFRQSRLPVLWSAVRALEGSLGAGDDGTGRWEGQERARHSWLANGAAMTAHARAPLSFPFLAPLRRLHSLGIDVPRPERLSTPRERRSLRGILPRSATDSPPGGVCAKQGGQGVGVGVCPRRRRGVSFRSFEALHRQQTTAFDPRDPPLPDRPAARAYVSPLDGVDTSSTGN